jgi:hypothetical protein
MLLFFVLKNKRFSIIEANEKKNEYFFNWSIKCLKRIEITVVKYSFSFLMKTN